MSGVDSLRREKLAVALIQRSIPHYRAGLFRKLTEDQRFDWTFYCGEHDEGSNSGLATDLSMLATRPLRVRQLVGNFVWHSDISVNSAAHAAIVADYGWTIVSNPVLFARARAAGIATIGWSKGVSQEQSDTKSRARRALERASISLCDAVVAYGGVSRDYFIDLGVPSESVFVAQNTIDTRAIASERRPTPEEIVALKRNLGLNPERLAIGFLGKVSRAKQVDAIVNAFDRLRLSGVDAQLVVAGSGPDARTVEARIAASPFSNQIVRVARVEPGAEADIFRAIDLYASYSQAGLGVLEALAYGTPVVATAECYPETELLEDNITAFVATEKSVEAFAKALARAAGDPDARERIASQGRAGVIARATLEGMVEAICGAVSYALSRRLERKRKYW